MNQLAPLVFLGGVLGLFLLDRERNVKTSKALCLPVLWVSIAGSRMVSQWLQMRPLFSADQLSEGSPLDRLVLMGFLTAGVGVLVARRRRVASLMRANGPILVFLLYCAASIVWSDYPDVAFKRWSKSVGDIVMVLIVLSDAEPLMALKRFFARTSFVLLPLSILFIRYYPELGRVYDPWVGTASFTGVTTDKNMLGVLCLALGLGVWWRFLQCFRTESRSLRWKQLLAHGVTAGMALWLLFKAHSMTSLACSLMSAGLMTAVSIRALAKRRFLVHAMVIAVLTVTFSVLFLNVGTSLVTAMGRDTTLTGRTDVWKTVLGMPTNPILGTGFESFWLGSRLERLWSIYWWRPTEAHNGYIEVFLNLGCAGLVLLAVLMGTAYRRAVDAVYRHTETGCLALGYFTAAIAYNFTEAAFKMMNLVWICLLLSTIAVSPALQRRKPMDAGTEKAAPPADGWQTFEEAAV